MYLRQYFDVRFSVYFALVTSASYRMHVRVYFSTDYGIFSRIYAPLLVGCSAGFTLLLLQWVHFLLPYETQMCCFHSPLGSKMQSELVNKIDCGSCN